MKLQVRKLLRAGLDASFIVAQCNVSHAQVKEWEEEYLREILASGSGHRARLRDLLLRNSPQMINVIFKLASQDVDSKLQMSAATTFLNFATRFFKEDATLAKAEAAVSDRAAGMETTLFDFTIPGEPQKQPPPEFDDVSPDDLLDGLAERPEHENHEKLNDGANQANSEEELF